MPSHTEAEQRRRRARRIAERSIDRIFDTRALEDLVGDRPSRVPPPAAQPAQPAPAAAQAPAPAPTAAPDPSSAPRHTVTIGPATIMDLNKAPSGNAGEIAAWATGGTDSVVLPPEVLPPSLQGAGPIDTSTLTPEENARLRQQFNMALDQKDRVKRPEEPKVQVTIGRARKVRRRKARRRKAK